MKTVPIVEHFRADPPLELRNRVDRLASALQRQRPEVAMVEPFHSLLPRRLDDGPTLYLDDLSEIPKEAPPNHLVLIDSEHRVEICEILSPQAC